MTKKDEKARENLVDALRKEDSNSENRKKSKKGLKFTREESE